MFWYDDLAVAVNNGIRSLPWDRLLAGSPAPEITSRAKTIDTLTEKLRRDPSTPLPSIQDVAGVRFECEMTLEEQDLVASTIAREFGCASDAVRDLRDGRHCGYRAVHVWLRLPHGRVEIQVRTHIQGEWANTYEALADHLGREIRYGELPRDQALASMVEDLQDLSTGMGHALERARQELATSSREIAERRVDEGPAVQQTEPGTRDVRRRLRGIRELRRRNLRERLTTDTMAHQLRALEHAYTGGLRDLQETLVAARDRGDRSWPDS